METETACEKITTEIMIELAELFDEQGWIMYEKERYRIIYSKVQMALGIGYNEGIKNLQRRNRKRIIQMNLMGKAIKLWDTIGEASKATGVDRSQIGKVARGADHYDTAGGFKWKYADK